VTPGTICFDDFVKWISDERDKDSQKGMKMRMLKLKMRANHLTKNVKEVTVSPSDEYGMIHRAPILGPYAHPDLR
jgi:hypothetical protein